MLFRISVQDSVLDQVLVISTHEPAKIDYNAILKTIPTHPSTKNFTSSLSSSKPSHDDQPNPFLRQTKAPAKIFIFNEVETDRNIPSIKTKIAQTSLKDNANFESHLTRGNGGSIFVVDPQTGFELFNTENKFQSLSDSSKPNKQKPIEPEVVQTTERSFDYLMSRDVFIPEQIGTRGEFIPQQVETKVFTPSSPTKNEDVTMEYDFNSYDAYPDYAFNEMDFGDMSFHNELDPFEYQDELDMPTLDTSLHSIEESAPKKFRPPYTPKSILSKPTPEVFKEESAMHGRL